MGRFTAVAILSVVVTVFLSAPPAIPLARSQEQTIAITNGRVFDATGAPVIEDGVVVIEGERIVAVGTAAEVVIPAGALIIDVRGGLIMPGVIDNHMHLEGGRLVQDDYLTPWLEAGVTTLVNNGLLRDGAVLANGLVIDDGVDFLRVIVEGLTKHPPRMLLAGPILTAPGGYPSQNANELQAQAAQFVDGPDDARSRVVRLIDEQGVDLIKVAIEAGGERDLDNPVLPVLDMDTLSAIVDATHERGLTARAHVTNEGELLAAIDAGFDVAAHTPFFSLEDEVLERALDAGMILVSTANIWGNTRGPVAADNVARYVALGGRAALGTDFPFQAGSEMPVKEMQLLVGGGLTPEQVLIAATRDSAAAVGREHDLGTLEPGKLADVIVIDGDPLSNVADMANVTLVLLEGEIVPRPSVLAPVGDANCDFTVSSIDAALILQHGAGLLAELVCVQQADVDASGEVDAVDAALVLQFVAGLLEEL